MKKRIAYISLYFFTVLLIFILQKPLFMLYNGAIEKGFGFTDFLHVMIHGAGLDAAMTGYLTAFPFLLILISIWFRRFPLKKILWGYYAFVATLVNPEKPDVPLNKNDAFQKVQKRHVQEKR